MKYKNGKCEECKETKAIYCKKMCQYCYWKSKTKTNKPRKRKSIKPISDKMAKKLAIYRPLRDKYMNEHPICEFKGCNNLSNDLHHKKPRATHLNDVTIFSALCRKHHNWVHDNHEEAVKLGWL